MRCKNCKREDKQIKSGKIRAGSQIYKCKHCNKKYTPNPKERMYSKEIKKQAIKIYYAGVSGRSVGKIFNMNKSNVVNWIKKERKK